MPVSNSKRRHLNADQKVLDGGGNIVGSVALDLVREGAEPDQNGQKEALPVRREDDELDAEKLGHRAERLQIVVHAHPEQPQRVQTDGHAEVVDHAAPEIARAEPDIALLVCACRLHDDGGQGEDRLEPRILQYATLYGEKGVRIRYVDLRKDMVDGPDMVNRLAAVCHDDEGSFTAEVVDQQLKEGVDGEGLER